MRVRVPLPAQLILATSKFRTQVQHFIDVDGRSIPINHEPAENIDPYISKDGSIVRYACQEYGSEYEFEEGVEFVQNSSRWINYLSPESIDAWEARLSPDHDIFLARWYADHTTMWYVGLSSSDKPMATGFASSDGFGCIAIPNENHENPFTDTKDAANNILKEYETWARGEVYRVASIAAL